MTDKKQEIISKLLAGNTTVEDVEKAFNDDRATVIKAGTIHPVQLQSGRTISDLAFTRNTAQHIELEVDKLAGITKITATTRDDKLNIGETSGGSINLSDGNDKLVIEKSIGAIDIKGGSGSDNITVKSAPKATIETDPWSLVWNGIEDKDTVTLGDVPEFTVTTRQDDDLVTLGAGSTRNVNGGTQVRKINAGGGNDTVSIDRYATDYLNDDGTLRVTHSDGIYTLQDKDGNLILLEDVENLQFKKDPRGFDVKYSLSDGRATREAGIKSKATLTNDKFRLGSTDITYDKATSMPRIVDGEKSLFGTDDVFIPTAAGAYEKGDGKLRYTRDARGFVLTSDTGHELILRGIEKIIFQPHKQDGVVGNGGIYNISGAQPVKDVDIKY